MINSGSLEVESNGQQTCALSILFTYGVHAEEGSIVTTCPFVFYGQLQPVKASVANMEELEREMENPTGIATVKRPPLKLHAVLISRECGILLQIQDAIGLTCVFYSLDRVSHDSLA